MVVSTRLRSDFIKTFKLCRTGSFHTLSVLVIDVVTEIIGSFDIELTTTVIVRAAKSWSSKSGAYYVFLVRNLV